MKHLQELNLFQFYLGKLLGMLQMVFRETQLLCASIILQPIIKRKTTSCLNIGLWNHICILWPIDSNYGLGKKCPLFDKKNYEFPVRCHGNANLIK